jgi:GNAT superfamily N-acetyltransferase
VPQTWFSLPKAAPALRDIETKGRGDGGNVNMKITPTTVLDFKVAHPENLPVVIDILSEAAAWIKDKGIDQWPSPLNEYWRQRIAHMVQRGEFFTVGVVKKRLGIVRITDRDRHWPDDGQAIYIGVLAIRDSMHGQGLGAYILNWAALKAQREGKRFLRLDCLASNRRLRRYYEDQGFLYKGQFTSGEYVAAMYEKPLSTLFSQSSSG